MLRVYIELSFPPTWRYHSTVLILAITQQKDINSVYQKTLSPHTKKNNAFHNRYHSQRTCGSPPGQRLGNQLPWLLGLRRKQQYHEELPSCNEEC